MASEDEYNDYDPRLDWRRRPEPRWLDRTPWAQYTLGAALVLCIALPIYTRFPKGWAFVGSLLVVGVVLVLSGPRTPRTKPD